MELKHRETSTSKGLYRGYSGLNLVVLLIKAGSQRTFPYLVKSTVVEKRLEN